MNEKVPVYCQVSEYIPVKADSYETVAGNDLWYDEVCKIDDRNTFDEKAVISSSCYGDGCYDLLVNKNDDGKVNFICIDYFI